jgi:hypothetical protein
MKHCCEIRAVLVNIAFIGTAQLFVIVGIAVARADAPPSPARAWHHHHCPNMKEHFASTNPPKLNGAICRRSLGHSKVNILSKSISSHTPNS